MLKSREISVPYRDNPVLENLGPPPDRHCFANFWGKFSGGFGSGLNSSFFLVLFIHALLPKSVKTLGLGRNSIHWEPLRYYVEVGESKITHIWGEYKGGQKKIGVTKGETALTT